MGHPACSSIDGRNAANLNSRGLPPTDASQSIRPAGVADAIIRPVGGHPRLFGLRPSGQMNSSPRRAPGQVRSQFHPVPCRKAAGTAALHEHSRSSIRVRVQAPAFGLRSPLALSQTNSLAQDNVGVPPVPTMRPLAKAKAQPQQGRHRCRIRWKQLPSSVRSGIVWPHKPIAVASNSPSLGKREGRCPPRRGSEC